MSAHIENIHSVRKIAATKDIIWQLPGIIKISFKFTHSCLIIKSIIFWNITLFKI